ncbi:hypothetical protein BIV57_07455 [Mangrovactinospora gilvigrisea]|uniref:Asparagine synthetase domain-containing protein n=1 Tax=Mangrovactinospora gilvigrisea TaxID=1428644 RepID=A0A1J7BHK9_9ACTN|nr:asparagine synthase-related protein [Mangrovactinospora gilvigrisea]OIV38142.1 hypothetical protein BIV57_07455 [Mangrovactinospora gilvigrisea]
MRWLVGWSGTRAGYGPHDTPAVHPVGARQIWSAPDPLWAVGDWRDDEIRTVTLPRPPRPAHLPASAGDAGPVGDGIARLAVLGRCPASDDQLRGALVRAAAGALGHLAAWPGSYTVVIRAGRRTAVVGDLVGARPVFHAPWAGGTAYATAGLPLADLLESDLDLGHLAARLACPESPEVIDAGAQGQGRPALTTPYRGVLRVPPGHALVVRDGKPDVPSLEQRRSHMAGPAPEPSRAQALDGLREALQEAVQARGFAELGELHRPGADLSGGTASAALALLAAGRPGGLPGGRTAPPLLAVTFTDTATPGGPGTERELQLARTMAADRRLEHVVVPGGADALPFTGLEDGPLTDEPSPALVHAGRERHRLAAASEAGGDDHLTGHGARQALDGHPARLVDLYLDRRRRAMVKPLRALARVGGGQQLLGSALLWRSVSRAAHTPYRHGLEDLAALLAKGGTGNGGSGAAGAGGPRKAFARASFAWCTPGPAARWLTGEVLADIAGSLDHAARVPDPPDRPGRHRSWQALGRAAEEYRALEQAAEVTGQRLHAPFLDNVVVRACREIPETVRVQPGARPELLRAVLDACGVRGLPEGFGASSRPDTALAMRTGLRVAAEELHEMFAASVLEKAGLVDPRPVRAALRAAADGEDVPAEGLAELIAVEVWLRRLLSRRGSCWTGTGPPRRMAVTAF